MVTHGITFFPHIVRREGERHILAAYPNRLLEKELYDRGRTPIAFHNRETRHTTDLRMFVNPNTALAGHIVGSK